MVMADPGKELAIHLQSYSQVKWPDLKEHLQTFFHFSILWLWRALLELPYHNQFNVGYFKQVELLVIQLVSVK